MCLVSKKKRGDEIMLLFFSGCVCVCAAARAALHRFIQSRESTQREKDLLKSVKVTIHTTLGAAKRFEVTCYYSRAWYWVNAEYTEVC